MQAAKDSFYVELRNRLIAVDPQRTVTLDGARRAAIAVVENEPEDSGSPLGDTFYLHWGNARVVQPGVSTLMAAECTISYWTRGAQGGGGLDRGHDLGSLDSDVLAICAPTYAAKFDYSSGTAVSLGSMMFWTQPVFNAAKAVSPNVGRGVAITVFFYPEVNQK